MYVSLKQALPDVYRSENAEPADWIMVGNHDTAPIWKLADQWRESGAARAQAEYLAARLCPDGGREGLAAELAAHPGKLVEAKFADLFASRAENVMVFFADLLGIKEAYNVPGTVSAANWTLRVPADYEREYGRRVGERTALDLRRALALAMRSRGELFVRRHAELVARLEAGG
jgi:4-alpha-glucanotransferase